MTSTIPANTIATIIEMSQWVGDPTRDLVILAEGNTSLKQEDQLVVKASGSSLDGASREDFVQVRRAPLLALIEDGTANDDQVADTLKTSTTVGTKRPSVETLLHVVCQEYAGVNAVIHAHPTPINALLCSTRAHALVQGSFFPDQIVTLGHNPLLIPYVDPGLELAHHAHRVVREHVERTGAVPKVIYLQNHGMFALGADPAEAQRITLMAVKSARIILGALSAGGVNGLTDEAAARIHTRPDEILRRELLAGSSSASPHAS